MMFDGPRWECPICHKHTFTQPRVKVANCQHCGTLMSTMSVLFVVATNMTRSRMLRGKKS